MPAGLTEEERLLRDTAQELARRFRPESPTHLPSRESAQRAWGALEGSGFTALLGTGAGGTPFGGGAIPAVLVAEQLARHLCSAPFLGQGVLAPALAVALQDEDGAAGAADERRTVAFGVATAGAPRPLALDAADAVDAWHIVLDGETVSAGRVPIGDAAAYTLDLTREMAWVDAAAAGGSRVELEEEAGGRFLALALAALSADMVGVMQGAIDLAVGYAGQREQFGSPIGSFQAIQQLLAEQEVHLRAARAATYYAAWATESLDPSGAVLAARVAKAYTSSKVRHVAEACIQVHGGIGMTWEALPHAYLRRGLLDRALLGDEHHQHSRIIAMRAEAA